jgi:pyruvate,orthophosphate dikinase
MAKSKKSLPSRSVRSATAARSAPGKKPAKSTRPQPQPKPARGRAAAPVKSRGAKPSAAKARPAKPVRSAAKSDPVKGKWVYTFGDGKAEGAASMRALLGGKGANLAEMANLGLPVPPGFSITTEVCTYFYANKESYPKELNAQVQAALAHVGRLTHKTFGDKDNPLLLSVRSGARASMPGMMDTVLNLGLNDHTVEALARASGDRRFAYDSYRRFITM